MGINALSASLTGVAADILDRDASVVELGSQELDLTADWLESFSKTRKQSRQLDAVRALSGKADSIGERAPEFYAALGMDQYSSIDINGQLNSLPFDLNSCIEERYAFTQRFDLVTNNGTTEHLFNQQAVFDNIHRLTSVDGLMLHAVPFLNYVNHCFFNYSPTFFYNLAVANGYTLLALGVGVMEGDAIVAAREDVEPLVKRNMIQADVVPFRRLLSRPRFKSGLAYYRKRYLRSGKDHKLTDDERVQRLAFGRSLADLMEIRRDLIVFALMRRESDADFQTPFQDVYREDIAEPEAAKAYALQSGSA